MASDILERIRTVFLKEGVDEEFLEKAAVTSVTLVGSQARQELMSVISDLDIIIVSKTQLGVNFYERMTNVISKLRSGLNLSISPQIFTMDEFSTLVSPSFMFEYSRDSKLIFGDKLDTLIESSLSKLSNSQIRATLSKRVLFEIFFFRQEVLCDSISRGTSKRIGKRLYWIVKNYVSILAGFETATSLEGWKRVLPTDRAVQLNELEIENIFAKKSVERERSIMITATIAEIVGKNYEVKKEFVW